MKKLVIFGAGQQGRICKNLAKKNGFKVVAFIDEYVSKPIENVPVYKSIYEIRNYKKFNYFVAFGDISLRRWCIELIKTEKLNTVNLVDKSVKIGRNITLGTGNFIFKDAIIYDDVIIGDYNIINAQSLIAIDSNIGENNNIGFGCKICGGVHIGNNNYIGAQSVFVSGSSIFDWHKIKPLSVIEGKE